MANYGLTTTALFRPLTFEELLKGPAMATLYQLDLEAKIQDLMDKAAVLELLSNNPNDIDVYNNYKNFLDRLLSAANDLYNKGFQNIDKNQFRNLKNDYNTTILPILNAYNKRELDIKAYNDALARDPSRITNINPNNIGLSSYMGKDNQIPLVYGVSGDNIMDLAAKMMSNLSKARPLNGGITKVMDNMLFKIGNGYGYSEKDIEDLKKYPEIQAIIDNIMLRPEVQRLGKDNQAAVENRVVEGILAGRLYDWKNSYMNAPKATSGDGSGSGGSKRGNKKDDEEAPIKTRLISFNKDNPVGVDINKMFDNEGNVVFKGNEKNMKKVVKQFTNRVAPSSMISDTAIKASMNGLDNLKGNELYDLIKEYYPDNYKDIRKESETSYKESHPYGGYTGMDPEVFKEYLYEQPLFRDADLNISLNGGLMDLDNMKTVLGFMQLYNTDANQREFLYGYPFNASDLRDLLKSSRNQTYRPIMGINPDNPSEYIYDKDLGVDILGSNYDMSGGNIMFDENTNKFLINYHTIEGDENAEKFVEFYPNLTKQSLDFFDANFAKDETGYSQIDRIKAYIQLYEALKSNPNLSEADKVICDAKLLELYNAYETIRRQAETYLDTVITNSSANINTASSALNAANQGIWQ